MSLLKAPPPYRYRFNPYIPNSVVVFMFVCKQVCRQCLKFLASSWDIKLRSDLYTNPDSAQNRIRIRNLAFMVEHRICCKYVTRQNSLKLEIELENVGQRNGFHLTVFLPERIFSSLPHVEEVLSIVILSVYYLTRLLGHTVYFRLWFRKKTDFCCCWHFFKWENVKISFTFVRTNSCFLLFFIFYNITK